MPLVTQVQGQRSNPIWPFIHLRTFPPQAHKARGLVVLDNLFTSSLGQDLYWAPPSFQIYSKHPQQLDHTLPLIGWKLARSPTSMRSQKSINFQCKSPCHPSSHQILNFSVAWNVKRASTKCFQLLPRIIQPCILNPRHSLEDIIKPYIDTFIMIEANANGSSPSSTSTFIPNDD